MVANNPTADPLLIPVSGVCRLLSISRSSFFSLRSAGRIPLQQIRLSTKLLYRADEVRNWVQAGCPAMEKWQQMKGME
jgi:predicted DNA-binding transcriptional regulator AlpA